MFITDKSTDNKIMIFINQTSIYGEDSIKFKKFIKEKLNQKVDHIHLDLGKVKYIDSTTIGSLLYFIQILKKSDKKIHIDKITDELKELLENLMLGKYIHIKKD